MSHPNKTNHIKPTSSTQTASRTPLIIAFSAILVLCVLVGTAGIIESNTAHNRLETIVEKLSVKLTLITQMYRAARERSIVLYKMVTLDDPFERDEAFMQFNHYAAEFSVAYNQMLSMDLISLEQELLDQVVQATDFAVPLQRQVADLAWKGKTKTAQILLTQQTVPAQGKVLERLTHLQNLQLKTSYQIKELSARSSRQVQLIITILTIIALLSGLYIAVLVTRRITRIEKTLQLEKELAEVTLHSIGDAIITTDNHGIVQYINPVAAQLTGWRIHDAVGHRLDEVFHIMDENSRKRSDNPVTTALNEHIIFSLAQNTILIRKDEAEFAIELTTAPIMDEQQEIYGAILVFRDVSEIRSMSYKLSYQATHDGLTGLVNRREFEVRLEQAIHNARNENTAYALCYLDLDQFKIVNDTAGHAAGDELLKQLANKLSPLLRKSDVLARLGGDEFGVLLEGCDTKQAYKIADNIRATIKEVRFPWGNNTFEVGVSIGLVPITAESGGVSDILSAADTTCYAAKENGRNQIQIYHEDNEELSKRKTEIRWVQDIQQALDNDAFVLYCQSIVPLKDDLDNLPFCELLIRLQGKNGELIPPMAFLPAAERYGLIQDIDKWVMHHALRVLENLPNEENSTPLQLSINISGYSLSDSAFLDYVQHEIRNSHCEHGQLCFEITETAAIANMSKAIHFIKTLKELGCKFALDDFGNGLSSFAYLKNMPVDFLKIDGSFVRDICHDEIDLAFVEAIHRIGTMMQIATIAEYVESKETLLKLKDIGIDYAQGFHIGMPQSFKDITNY